MKAEEEEKAESEVKLMMINEAEVKAEEEAESKQMNERANVRDKDVFFYLDSPS